MNGIIAEFRPVIEGPYFEPEQPWPWLVANWEWFRPYSIGRQSNDLEIGSMVAELCQPLDIENGISTSELLRQLQDLDYYCLRGGLQVVVDGEVIVSPGCCTGLESWRELFSLLNGTSPWMGHDPTPWCEFPDECSVRFWAEGGFSARKVEPTVLLTRQQVSEQLQHFHNQLHEVMARLQQWLTAHECDVTDAIVDKFGRSFAITTEVPLFEIVG